jgi:LppX/LprAFG-like lipoprotein
MKTLWPSALIVLVLAVLVPSEWTKAAQQPRPAVNANQAYLNRAADALVALKSTRFSLKREGAPAFLDEKSGITFTAADCIYAAPDRVSCNVKVSLKNGTIVQLTRVWVPEGTFQTNPLTRLWAKVPADANFNGVLLFAKTGIADILRTSVQKTQLAGKEKVENKDTLRLKGEVSGQKLSPLIGSTIKPELMYPVDLWIDERSSNTAQLHVAEPDGNGWLIELAGTDEAVDIPTPRLPPPPPGRL